MPSYKNKIDHIGVADITSVRLYRPFIRNLVEPKANGDFPPQANAFDEAVKEVDGIIHLASPVSFTVDDPQGELFLDRCCICLYFDSSSVSFHRAYWPCSSWHRRNASERTITWVRLLYPLRLS